ncbi:MAG: hypothetical protein WC565_07860 [Parcubacteria group bacterium]
MHEETLKRLDELMTYARCQNISSQRFHDMWQALRAELHAERCENCQLWDSDPSSASEVKIPEKTYVRVCFGLTLQDVWSGNFGVAGNRSAILTGPDFCCSHFEKKEPTP